MMFMLAARGTQALACSVSTMHSLSTPTCIHWPFGVGTVPAGSWGAAVWFSHKLSCHGAQVDQAVLCCAQAAYLAKLLTHHGVQIPDSPILHPDAGNMQQHVQRGTQLGYDVAYKPDRLDGHDLFQSPQQTGTSSRPSSRDVACRWLLWLLSLCPGQM